MLFLHLSQGLNSEAMQKILLWGIKRQHAFYALGKKKEEKKVWLLCCHRSKASFTQFALTALLSGLSEQDGEPNAVEWQLQIYCI